MARLIAAVLLFCGWIAPASAADVFFYSPADEYYGWAAGYGPARSASDAEGYCIAAGGTQCTQVLSCDGGWGAIAFADDSAKGVGMVCGVGDSVTARFIALALCMGASRAMCWTDAAFDGHARKISDDANLTFDQTYFAQQMLHVLGLLNDSPADGDPGPRTREAVSAFQTKLGLDPTGKITTDLLWRLLSAVDGPQVLANGLYRASIEPNMGALADRIYSDAPEPRPELTYSRELVDYSEDEQRLALATILAIGGNACSLPAQSATPVPPDGSGGWHVRCAEGDYTILFSPDNRTVMSGLKDIVVDGATISVDNGRIVIEGSSGAPADPGGTEKEQ